MTDKLPRHIKLTVEGELRSYKGYKKQIDILKDDIIHAGNRAISGMPIYHSGESQTENKGFRLATDAKIAHLEYVVHTIERVYDSLPEVEQEIVRKYYFESSLNDYGMRSALFMGRKDLYYEHKKRIIMLFAQALGLWW